MAAESETLRGLLARQTAAARDEAIRNGGQVSVETAAALERLARLAEIEAANRPGKKRWPLVAALLLTLLVVSLLLFVRVPRTEIELNATVTETGFVLAKPQLLTEALQVVALGAAGLREIELPGNAKRPPRIVRAENDAALRLAAADRPGGSITVEPLALPAGTYVGLRRGATPNRLRLSIAGAGIVVRANVNGPVQAGLAGEPAEQIDFARPAPVLLRAADQLDLDLEFAKLPADIFVPQLAVRELALARIEQFVDAERTLLRRLSTIVSGSLYFESLDGRERKLRAGEAIGLAEAIGELRTVRLGEANVALAFHGSVGDIRGGTEAAARSLMPTVLEWLQARHGLSLLWGTSLYLFGLLAAVLRWWGLKL